MNLDSRNFFCENKQLTDANDATDWLDTLAGGGVMADTGMTIFVSGKVDASGGTSFRFDVETSDNQSTVKTIAAGATVTAAEAKAGTFWARIPWPRGFKRYVRLKINKIGSFTAGKYSAFVAKGEEVSFEDL